MKNLDKNEKKSDSSQNPLKLLDLLYKHHNNLEKTDKKTPNSLKKAQISQRNQVQNNPMNKSYDLNIKQKFIDLERNKMMNNNPSSQRYNLENSKQNLHYISDIRPQNDNLKNFSDKNVMKPIKKNLLPDHDLGEILDKFSHMETIGNSRGFLQSMKFIMNEIRGRFPKTEKFMNKIEVCYEKLIEFLLEKVEKIENIPKDNIVKNITKIEKNDKLEEKSCQTTGNSDVFLENFEQLMKEKAELASQNNRLILILRNLNKRGIDIEKLFEKQLDLLLNPHNNLNSSQEIKRFHMDSEGFFIEIPYKFYL